MSLELLLVLPQILLIIGAAIFGLLGALHLYFTFFGNKFHAADKQTTSAMQQTHPKITRQTTMWNAWIGFNASHSFGAILIAAFYIPLAINEMAIINHSLWFANLPVFIGLSYLLLAKKYWFRIPQIGILLATLCFLAATLAIQFS